MTAELHREDMRKLHADSLVTAAILISPDGEDFKLFHSDSCNPCDVLFSLEDGWKFAGIYGFTRQPDARYIVTFRLLEGGPVGTLEKARRSFEESIVRRGIGRNPRRTSVGNA